MNWPTPVPESCEVKKWVSSQGFQKMVGVARIYLTTTNNRPSVYAALIMNRRVIEIFYEPLFLLSLL
jgi:hypothetical protein